MIKLEVNEKGNTTVELKGKIPDICTDLTMLLLDVIKANKRFAGALRMALLATGEMKMPTAEKVALVKTMIEFKDGEKK